MVVEYTNKFLCNNRGTYFLVAPLINTDEDWDLSVFDYQISYGASVKTNNTSDHAIHLTDGSNNEHICRLRTLTFQSSSSYSMTLPICLESGKYSREIDYSLCFESNIDGQKTRIQKPQVLGCQLKITDVNYNSTGTNTARKVTYTLEKVAVYPKPYGYRYIWLRFGYYNNWVVTGTGMLYKYVLLDLSQGNVFSFNTELLTLPRTPSSKQKCFLKLEYLPTNDSSTQSGSYIDFTTYTDYTAHSASDSTFQSRQTPYYWK